MVEFNDLDAALAAIDEHTAGFLLEPIQGEAESVRRRTNSSGCVRPATSATLSWCSTRCSAVARTGATTPMSNHGLEPDIMATAKGIGGGFPMGACSATEKAAAGMVIGTHGSTFGGNPLAMAAGQAVLDVVANEEFLGQVRAKGERLRAALEQMIPITTIFSTASAASA